MALPGIAMEYGIGDWEVLSRAFADMFEGLGDVKSDESIRLIGPETDYTYRVPPAILRRRGGLRGLSRLWCLR